MNTPLQVTLNITGHLTLDTKGLEQLFSGLQIQAPSPTPAPASTSAPPITTIAPTDPANLPRLAYTVNEVAEMLGIAPKTVYRLMDRGLLRNTGALRHKRITMKEIDRFLKETSRSAY